MAQSLASILITHRIQSALTKPLFGKAHISIIHFAPIAGFMLEVSAVLAAKYRLKPIPFISAFIGNAEDAESLYAEFLEDWAELGPQLKDAKSFISITMDEAKSKIGETDSLKFLEKAKRLKSEPENFYNGVMNYVVTGLSLGFFDPEETMRLYEGTHLIASATENLVANQFKVERPHSQTYLEFEASMYDILMEYCDEVRPDIKHELKC